MNKSTQYIRKDPNGDTFYCQDEKFKIYHREDGPAIEWADGTKEWRNGGLRHNLNGPALVCPNGHREWWIEGNQYTEKEFDKQNNLEHYFVYELAQRGIGGFYRLVKIESGFVYLNQTYGGWANGTHNTKEAAIASVKNYPGYTFTSNGKIENLTRII